MPERKQVKKGSDKMKELALLLGVALLLEVFVFHWRFLSTLGGSDAPMTNEGTDAEFIVSQLGAPLGTLHIDASATCADGTQSPILAEITLADEGNAMPYTLDTAVIYPGEPKSTYLNVHAYGEVSSLVIRLTPQKESELVLFGITRDASVPFFFSGLRVLLVWCLLLVFWALRPATGLVDKEPKPVVRKLITAAIISANVLFLLLLVRWAAAFLHPVWAYHYQYQKLAEALSEGHLWIDAGNEEILAALQTMDNPYDFRLRMDMVPGADAVWDTAYFDGRFYVYFGIVPELMYYLPCHLILHRAFPTWLGVWISASLALGGMYFLLHRLFRAYFRELPWLWRLVLSFLAANSLNLMTAALHADLYYLPVVTAMAFALWGLGLFVLARERLEAGSEKGVKPAFVFGALCLALTAGCRPQFLVSIFLLIPLFWTQCLAALREKKKGTLAHLFCVFAPMAVVAAALMLYNAARFGSPFDFGSTYVLTNSDMNHRSRNLELALQGLYCFWLQPTGVSNLFPFPQPVTHYFGYLGPTVYDLTMGGILRLTPILLGTLGVVAAGRELLGRRLLGLVLFSVCCALVVTVTDTLMAGVQVRYYLDFVWLLVLAAFVVLAALMQRACVAGGMGEAYLRYFVLLTGFWGLLIGFAAAVRTSEIVNDNVRVYYAIRAFFP